MLQRIQGISEIGHTYLDRFRPVVLRISSDDGSMFFGGKGVCMMKRKLTMSKRKDMTLEEGCNLHLANCRQRNLREDTIRHYKDAYVQFKKYFSPEMRLSEITEKKYQAYVLHLKNNLGSDETVRTYVRSLRAVFYFLMHEGYI